MALDSPTFLLHLYKDEEYARPMISQLRRFYPRQPIVCIADGVRPYGFDAFAQEYDVRYIQGDRLKLREHGTAWSHRMFCAMLGLGDPVVKLDADACLWRKFDSFCSEDMAGTYVCLRQQRLPMVRGGCIAYRQHAIAKILASKLLEDPCYRSPNYAYARYDEWRYADEPQSSELVYSEDPVIAHIAKRLRLTMTNWAECRIEFRGAAPENEGLQWAATHPHPKRQSYG